MEEHTTGTISFIDNTALVDGGAILLTNPDEVFIRDVEFSSNEAMFGGAVSLTSSAAESPVEFELCQFQSNNASRGGALYLNGEGQGMIRDSGFYDNVAGENSSRGVSRFDALYGSINRTPFFLCLLRGSVPHPQMDYE